MNDIFKFRNTDRLTREKNKLNLEIPKLNQATFGARSLRSYGPEAWYVLPYHMKTSDNLNSFKSVLGWKSLHLQSLRTYANIRLQDNRLSQNIILKYVILHEIRCEMKIL